MATGIDIQSVFDQHTARIRRIVGEEFAGGSAMFDKNAWPLIRFQVHDAQGRILSTSYHPFSVAELVSLTDDKLRAAIRKLCEPSAE
jgi:hypothetical protein